jgi:hydrogenase-4 component B
VPSEDTGSLLFVVALIAYATGGLGGALLQSRDAVANVVAFGFAILASSCAVGAAVLTLFGGGATQFELFPVVIPLLHVSVTLDALSAFFVLMASLLGIAISIYSLGYARGFHSKGNVGMLACFYNLLLLSITLVFCADNAFFFLVVWELMSLTAYVLVSFDHERPEARDAGVLFFVMSHIGTGCLVLGFLLLYQDAGSLNFAALDATELSTAKRNAVFLLFLVGFGVKAGLVPLHIWLPAAHPVAPSNVSALMSGVVIKTGIYGLVRVWFDFLGEPPMWWGVLVLVLGTLTALIGVLYALIQSNLKRLLAFSSIENIGIILIGLGAALLFQATHHNNLAALALIAALFHAMNHAMFKGLLFLGAGAVLHATHTGSIEDYGGLIRRMPRTALCFLIGAVTISGLPPLNGFVSEWLTYQSLLNGFNITDSLSRILFPMCGSLLALTAALAAACFVKAFGITFLAQPRSDAARDAHEASPTMLAGMGLLVVACFGLGIFATAFLTVFDPITRGLLNMEVSSMLLTGDGFTIAAMSEKAGSISPAGLLVLLLVLLPLPIGLCVAFRRGWKTRIGPTWDCGLRGLTPQMEYTGTAFSKPLQMIFRALFRPQRDVQADFEFSRYFTKAIRFEVRIDPAFERLFYQPAKRAILRIAEKLRAVQAGSVQTYLAYVFVTFLLLLLLTRWL